MSHFCLFSPLYLNLSYFLSHGVSSVVTSPRAILFYFICSSALTPEAFRSFSFFCLSFFFVCFCFHSTYSFFLSVSILRCKVLSFCLVCFCFYSTCTLSFCLLLLLYASFCLVCFCSFGPSFCFVCFCFYATLFLLLPSPDASPLVMPFCYIIFCCFVFMLLSSHFFSNICCLLHCLYPLL